MLQGNQFILLQAVDQKASLHPKVLEKINEAEKMFAWVSSTCFVDMKMIFQTKKAANQIKIDIKMTEEW